MIIGIGGVSTAGKTTTANKIRELFPGLRISILCQDDYVKAVEDIPRIQDRIDWESPDSIDHQRLIQTIHSESKHNELVIAEGLMIFHHPEVNALFDKRIFVSIDYQIFKQRKLLDNRWGHEPEWYIEHIWESFLRFGRIEPTADILFLDGNIDIRSSEILNFLRDD
jgi:uridine kinase